MKYDTPNQADHIVKMLRTVANFWPSLNPKMRETYSLCIRNELKLKFEGFSV